MSYIKTGKIKLTAYDRQWSRIVRQRDGYMCQVCGYYDEHYVAAHHIVGRVNKRLRLEPLNGISLCPTHHTFNSEFSAHRTPKDFKKWFSEKFPDRWKYINKVQNEHMSERQAVEEFKKL